MFPLAMTAAQSYFGGGAGGGGGMTGGDDKKGGAASAATATSGDVTAGPVSFGANNVSFGAFDGGDRTKSPSGAAGGLPPWLLPALAGISLGLTVGWMLGKK